MRIMMLAGLAVLWPLAAQEIKPFDVKLGLWEAAVKTEAPGMPAMSAMPAIPPEALAKLPPEKRAQIEGMMKSRQSGGPMTSKVCITKESLARGQAFAQNDKACTYKVLSSSSTKQVIHTDCNRGDMKMSGDMTVERVDAEHVKGAMAMKASGDHPMDMKMSFENKWLSTDCGDVKPVMPK